jgi:uncharacterized LabA/DUF88 family protein
MQKFYRNTGKLLPSAILSITPIYSMANGKDREQAMNEHVAIFIDGSNLYHSANGSFSLHDSELDFSKLLSVIKGARLLVGTYYYNAPLDRGFNEKTYWKQQRFFSELARIPDFHVILCHMRKLQKHGCKPEFYVKGDDIHLATDLISLAYENGYDTAILVSGDSDFVPAIRKVQKLEKKVENHYFRISGSNFLKKVCDVSVCLDAIIPKCLKDKE